LQNIFDVSKTNLLSLKKEATMKLSFFIIGIISTFLIFNKCSEPPKGQAPLFTNLGTHHFSVTTNSDLAQKYFNQGIILAYGFNHEEAFRSFKEAARLDSTPLMKQYKRR